MTDGVQWTDVEVPRGAYIGWGNRAGQHVTGKVLAYDDRGGIDFNGERCPEVQIELLERAASFNKDGERSDFEAGELVVLTCGQVSLKRAVRAASLEPGVLVKIELTGTVKVPNGTVKEFGIKVSRSSAGSSPRPGPSPASMPSNGSEFSSEPPF